MFDLDNWQEIFATLRANRLRTFLTAFGVFWGILMLMAMLGFGSAIQSGSKRQMTGMATNLLFVWGQTSTKPYDGLPTGRQVQFDTGDIELLRRLPGVEYLAPRLQLGGFMSGFNVSYEGKTGSYTVMADYPEFKHIVSFEYEEGRFINDSDIADRRKVAVIGQAVKTELFPADVDPVGKYLKISGVYFEIVGVTKTLRSGQQGDRDAHSVNVPFTTLKSSFHTGDKVGYFAMTAKPNTDGPELEREVREALEKKHRVDPDDHLAIGSFSTKEIGVRKALGATPFSIVAMVMKEAIVLTAIAGLLGVSAGVGLLALCDAIFSKIPDFPLGPPEVALSTVLTAVAVLIGAGALGGIMPASHAASIRPIEALRTE